MNHELLVNTVLVEHVSKKTKMEMKMKLTLIIQQKVKKYFLLNIIP